MQSNFLDRMVSTHSVLLLGQTFPHLAADSYVRVRPLTREEECVDRSLDSV